MAVTAPLDLGALGPVGIALADPTRRQVLVRLIDSPGYPAEMAEQFRTTLANLSPSSPQAPAAIAAPCAG